MKFNLHEKTTESRSEKSVSRLFQQVIKQYNKKEYLGLMDNTIIELAESLENHLRGTRGWFLDLGTHDDFTNHLDTAGMPIEKINDYLTKDIDEAVMIDSCSHGNDLLSNCSECDEEQARDSWVCGICGESTYDIEYDHVGSGTNHLSCELEIEMKDKHD